MIENLSFDATRSSPDESPSIPQDDEHTHVFRSDPRLSKPLKHGRRHDAKTKTETIPLPLVYYTLLLGDESRIYGWPASPAKTLT